MPPIEPPAALERESLSINPRSDTLSFPPNGRRRQKGVKSSEYKDTLRFPSLRGQPRREQTPTLAGVSATRADPAEPKQNASSAVSSLGESGEATAGDVVAERYALETIVGSGSMGVVWRATDRELQSTVAIKLVSGRVALAAEAAMRLREEASVLGFVDSPHVARIIDAGQLPSGAPYLVTEFLEGQTLDRVLDQATPATISDAVNWMSQAAEGLADVHELGIVHNDMKPSNVLLTTDDLGHCVVKLIDFGIAQVRLQPRSGAPTQEVVGSPWYLAPERIIGEAGDHRSDIWSLGVMLYELLAGRRPFEGATAADVCACVLEREPLPLHEVRSEVSRELSEVVRRCLQKRPEERYLSARLLALDLVRVSDARPPNVPESLAGLPEGSFAVSDVGAADLGNDVLEAQAITRAKLEAIKRFPEPQSPEQRFEWAAATPTTPRRKRRWPVVAAYLVPLALLTMVGYAAVRRGRPASSDHRERATSVSQYAARAESTNHRSETGKAVGAESGEVASPATHASVEAPARMLDTASAESAPVLRSGGQSSAASASPGASLRAAEPSSSAAPASSKGTLRSDARSSASPPRVPTRAAPVTRASASAVPAEPLGVKVSDIYVNARGELVDAQGRPIGRAASRPDSSTGGAPKAP